MAKHGETLSFRTSRRFETSEHVAVADAGQLVVVSGRGVGRRYMVTTQLELGRDTASPVQIDDDGVSRHHARITRTNAGAFFIQDLNSRNGTLVNGVRVTQAALEFGDKIAMGAGTVFLFTRHDRIEDQLLQAQKLQALGELAGGVAHDFNNLLGAILANVTHLTGLKTLDEGEVRECLGEVEHAVRRAVDLTTQLLAFARSGNREHDPTDFSALVERAIKLLRRALNRMINIDMDIDPALTVLGDQTQLLQIVMNLCLNAGDAMPEGGKLGIAAKPVTISKLDVVDRPLLMPGDYVMLVVSDTGAGMDDETQSKIFQPFFTTKDRGKGTGLGLATVYGIVQDHGGYIQVESSIGAGTRFRVYLPSADQGSEQKRMPTFHGGLRLLSGTVLVVDDEPIIRQTTQRVLEKAGLEVFLASDGSQAVGLYEQYQERVDLIILDLDMPRMGGEATLQALRQIDPSVKVLVSTGFSDRNRELELLETGTCGFLHKPYDSTQLRDAVASALDNDPS